MAFQVKFGSQSSLHEDSHYSRGYHASGRDGHGDLQGKAEAQHAQSGRGRGRGGRGRRHRGRPPRREGGNRFVEGDNRHEDGSGSEDSDGASSVASEGQGKQRGRRGTHRGQERRGRVGRGSYPPKGDNSTDQHRRSHSYVRPLFAEPAPSTGQQEIHIHYHALPQAGMVSAPLFSQQMTAAMHSPLQPPFVNQPAQQAKPPSLMGDIPQPQAPNVMPHYQQGYAPHQQQLSNQPVFDQSVIPAFSQPEGKQPLLDNPPTLHSAGSRQGPPRSFGQQLQTPPSRSAGPARGSSQSVNQTCSAQRNDRDVRPKQRGEGGKGSLGQKPVSTRGEHADRKPSTSSKLEQPSSSSDKPDIPELDPDEWIKLFKLMLEQFKGRTRLGTLFSRKGELFKGLSHAQAAAWLKHSSRFLTFEKNGQVKFVSVYFRDARMCFKYRKPNTDKCDKTECPFFHICREFVAGHCARQSKCHFNHSFHAKSNAKICAEASLQAFTDEEIRIMVFRSSPIVCDKFNKGACNEDCPDLHVCAQFIMNNCSDDGCRFGHKIKGTEHNDWVLSTFDRLSNQEQTLLKSVIVPKDELSAQNSKSQIPPMSSSDVALSSQDSGNSAMRHKPKTQKPTRQQSRENILTGDSDMSVPAIDAQVRTSAGRRQQHRKPKMPNLGKDTSDDSDIKVSSLMDNYASVGEEKHLPDPFSQQKTHHYTFGEMGSSSGQEQHTRGPCVLRGMKMAGRAGNEEQPALPANHYTHLCEHHTWTDSCKKGYLCPRYHHRHKPPFIWQLYALKDWFDFSQQDSVDIEQSFCQLETRVMREVVLEKLGRLQVCLDFNRMTVRVVESSVSMLAPEQTLLVRRWSTPTYVECEPGVPFSFYTQWIWYQMDQTGHFQPFIPGTLQYTLEEKYHSGQQKYYFEIDEERFLLYLQEMKLVSLSLDIVLPVLRRPFFSGQLKGPADLALSPLLLTEPPGCHWSGLPPHWATVDCYQGFEMLELDQSSSDFRDVERSFHSTLSREHNQILHVFRVQNPSLWDKYCSTKRAMTPRGGITQDVDERKLFHGTPTLLAARGICANNMDFRRAGENVGAMFGKGSYFSAHALYSHSYTRGPDRYMFLAKVLVGQFTKGHPSFSSPPVREGLKLYDSCVNDEANPTIFVIFDLAQSYPEYLIQYKEAEMGPGERVQSAEAPRMVTGSGAPGQHAARPVPRPRASVSSAVPKATSSAEETSSEGDFTVHQLRQHFERGTALDSQTSRSTGHQEKQERRSPTSQASQLASSSRLDLKEMSERELKELITTQLAAWRRASSTIKQKSDSDKCLIS